jgi:predicted porin
VRIVEGRGKNSTIGSRNLSLLVVLSGALAFRSGAARAEDLVQSRVYGFLNAEIERPWASGGATPYDGRSRVSDGGSRIGFLGAVAVGWQTSALWQLEGALNGFEQGGLTDLGDHTSIVSRNSFVGVENRRLGRLVAGNNDSAYRRLIGSGGDMGGNLGLTVLGLDLWNNTSAQLSGNGKSIFGRGEERYHNSVHYVSPAWRVRGSRRHLVQLAGSYGFDEALTLTGKRDRFSVAGLYRIGGFSLGAAFDRQANTGASVDALQRGFGLNTDAENGVATYYYEASASYHFWFGTYLGLGFERSNYGFMQLVPPTPTTFYSTLNVGVMRQSGGMFSVAQVIRKATLMASVGGLGSVSGAIYGAGRDYRAAQVSVGGKYAFNDHFASYVYFSAIQNRSRQDVNLGAPIYSNNLGTAQAYLAPGDNPRTAGVGALVRF